VQSREAGGDGGCTLLASWGEYNCRKGLVRREGARRRHGLGDWLRSTNNLGPRGLRILLVGQAGLRWEFKLTTLHLLVSYICLGYVRKRYSRHVLRYY